MSVIYLDNNATTSVAPEVFESMIPFFTEKYGNASSMHTFGGQVGKSIQDAREKVAAMLGAQPEEIVFTSCGTESDSTAVMSALQAQPEKKHVITTRVEHSALIALGQHLEQKGYVDTESLRHYPSILFGLETAMRHYEQGGWRHYDTPFSQGQAGIPIRIGVNGGSLEKELLAKYGHVTPEALVESALRHVRLLEKFDFTEICISVKSSDVPLNMAAYRLLHEKVDYPLHLGVTEAGTPTMGLLKSAIGIGGLLCEGIGDTMRVSLTADPVEEVYAAKRILQACGIRRSGVNLVSCPTCGRTAYDMIPIAEELERRLADCKKNITVAVMGCVVNGPGEASAADIGVAGGKGEGMIFRKGKILYKVPQEKLVDALMEEIKKL